MKIHNILRKIALATALATFPFAETYANDSDSVADAPAKSKETPPPAKKTPPAEAAAADAPVAPATAGEAAAKSVKNVVTFAVFPFDNQAQNEPRYIERQQAEKNLDRISLAAREAVEGWFVKTGKAKKFSVSERHEIDAIFDSGTIDSSGEVPLDLLKGSTHVVSGTITYIDNQEPRIVRLGSTTYVRLKKIRIGLRLKIVTRATAKSSYSGSYDIVEEMSESASHRGNFRDSGNFNDRDTIQRMLIKQIPLHLSRDEELKEFIEGVLIEAGISTPPPAPLSLSILPIPANCNIYIAGKLVGTNAVVRKFPAGKEVKIRITKAGYEPWEETVELSESMKLTPELAPARPLPPPAPVRGIVSIPTKIVTVDASNGVLAFALVRDNASLLKPGSYFDVHHNGENIGKIRLEKIHPNNLFIAEILPGAQMPRFAKDTQVMLLSTQGGGTSSTPSTSATPAAAPDPSQEKPKTPAN